MRRVVARARRQLHGDATDTLRIGTLIGTFEERDDGLGGGPAQGTRCALRRGRDPVGRAVRERLVTDGIAHLDRVERATEHRAPLVAGRAVLDDGARVHDALAQRAEDGAEVGLARVLGERRAARGVERAGGDDDVHALAHRERHRRARVEDAACVATLVEEVVADQVSLEGLDAAEDRALAEELPQRLLAFGVSRERLEVGKAEARPLTLEVEAVVPDLTLTRALLGDRRGPRAEGARHREQRGVVDRCVAGVALVVGEARSEHAERGRDAEELEVVLGIDVFRERIPVLVGEREVGRAVGRYAGLAQRRIFVEHVRRVRARQIDHRETASLGIARAEALGDATIDVDGHALAPAGRIRRGIDASRARRVERGRQRLVVAAREQRDRVARAARRQHRDDERRDEGRGRHGPADRGTGRAVCERSTSLEWTWRLIDLARTSVRVAHEP